MKTPLPREQIQRALDSLKDFQRDTAEYVFSRLYGANDPCRRVLVSDEVGLGKTMVAKGVIARTLEHLWERVKRIDVVYICSNADIARQNVNRLNVLDQESGFRTASRLTLLAREMAELGDVNFIALTPNTSFDLGSSLGVVHERVLLYWLLRETWGFGNGAGPYNVLMGNVDANRFKSRVQEDRPAPAELAQLSKRFVNGLGPEGETALRAEFESLCERFSHRRSRLEREERKLRNSFVGKTRAALARSCIEELNPDLVILDEFQRFKDILSGDDEAAQLARTLFEYQDEHSEAKVILLSATPYRMLTLASQGEDEDHYADFLKTLEFLVPERASFTQYREAVEAFRFEFLKLRTSENVDAVLEAKSRLARLLRRVMVRTERLAHTPDRSGMLQERRVTETLQASDLGSYLCGQRIAAALKQRDTIEYWKSAPYFLSFLEGYKLREHVRLAARDENLGGQVAKKLRDDSLAVIPSRRIADEATIEPGNARLRGFLDAYLEDGAGDVLWIPPSLPYYGLEGAFDHARARGLTKRLIFSSWRMVPRALAAVMSYIVANRSLELTVGVAVRTSSAKTRWPSPLLRFARDADKRLTGMPVTTLIFPAPYMAREFDPLTVTREWIRANGRTPSLSEMRYQLTQRVQGRLYLLDRWMGKSATPDERWYWAAPVLFEIATNWGPVAKWLRTKDLAAFIQGEESEEGADENWLHHMEELQKLLDIPVLGECPADLVSVLVEAALGSPAICAFRALTRSVTPRDAEDVMEAMDRAAAIGWAARNMFNLPEAIVMLRAQSSDEPYWRRVLQYSAEGCLQAVLDEYMHMSLDSSGLWNASFCERAIELAGCAIEALTLRPSAIGADEYTMRPERNGFDIMTHRMKGRFAMPLVELRAEDTGTEGRAESQATRTTRVRDAFNSPFWPFVVASTSIGQEGLDFHPYCHAVVHWNLPSNPVDMEQREGRVHRFKGHAVRKNLAAEYGLAALANGTGDPWATIFDEAVRDRPEAASDLVPFWIFPRQDGAVVERHVPGMPMSRERERIIDLRKTLAVYRMVFGQPRQEDLIEYLMTRFGEDERARLIDELRIDLSPPGYDSGVPADLGAS